MDIGREEYAAEEEMDLVGLSQPLSLQRDYVTIRQETLDTLLREIASALRHQRVDRLRLEILSRTKDYFPELNTLEIESNESDDKEFNCDEVSTSLQPRHESSSNSNNETMVTTATALNLEDFQSKGEERDSDEDKSPVKTPRIRYARNSGLKSVTKQATESFSHSKGYNKNNPNNLVLITDVEHNAQPSIMINTSGLTYLEEEVFWDIQLSKYKTLYSLRESKLFFFYDTLWSLHFGANRAKLSRSERREDYEKKGDLFADGDDIEHKSSSSPPKQHDGPISKGKAWCCNQMNALANALDPFGPSEDPFEFYFFITPAEVFRQPCLIHVEFCLYDLGMARINGVYRRSSKHSYRFPCNTNISKGFEAFIGKDIEDFLSPNGNKLRLSVKLASHINSSGELLGDINLDREYQIRETQDTCDYKVPNKRNARGSPFLY